MVDVIISLGQNQANEKRVLTNFKANYIIYIVRFFIENIFKTL